MKLSPDEKQELSDSIDKMNEALDIFIQLYNDADEDKRIIEFDDETVQILEQAIDSYGKEVIEKKVNTIIREIFSFH
ncbi:atypical membrane-integrating protein (Mistic protein) [Bacillus sp. FJAT-47783]|uniref:atypical membrane-integrating protein (Mistic protein) n=1 Tax=Bacillus sp. FJAT-47783 TaxID=2922712 RepID=UPI001FAB95E0|nr:atypical membrane-integrating protein (Mistic protein) [Bacillus sp. FJAT-47783]